MQRARRGSGRGGVTAARFGVVALSLACCALALSCEGPTAKPDAPVSGEPAKSDGASTSTASPGSAAVDTRVEAPGPEGGGQSGSIGSSDDPCMALPARTVSADDEALPGYTLADLGDWLAETFGPPRTLIWHFGDVVPTSVELSFELESAAELTPYAMRGDANDRRCSFRDQLRVRGRMRARTADGWLDAETECEIMLEGAGSPRGLAPTFRNLLARDALSEPLQAAIDEALAAVGASREYAGLELRTQPGNQQDTEHYPPWEVVLALVSADPVVSPSTVRVALSFSEAQLPQPREPFTPASELAAACEQAAMNPPPAAAPAAQPEPELEVALAAPAGTWLLCSGQYPASTTLEHAGIRIDEQGRFTLLGLEQGELVELSGFGQKGRLWFWPVDRYFEFAGTSVPATTLTYSVEYRADLLIPDDQGLHDLRGLVELRDGGRTLRFGPLDEVWVDPVDLVHLRTDLPVRSAPPPAFAPGTRAGAEGCAARESLVRMPTIDDAASLIGTFAICSGNARGATQLELANDGSFRELGAQGELVRSGSYQVFTDPSQFVVSSVFDVAELVLTDAAGLQDAYNLAAVSDAPYELLLSADPAVPTWGVDRYTQLSPLR